MIDFAFATASSKQFTKETFLRCIFFGRRDNLGRFGHVGNNTRTILNHNFWYSRFDSTSRHRIGTQFDHIAESFGCLGTWLLWCFRTIRSCQWLLLFHVRRDYGSCSGRSMGCHDGMWLLLGHLTGISIQQSFRFYFWNGSRRI